MLLCLYCRGYAFVLTARLSLKANITSAELISCIRQEADELPDAHCITFWFYFHISVSMIQHQNVSIQLADWPCAPVLVDSHVFPYVNIQFCVINIGWVRWKVKNMGFSRHFCGCCFCQNSIMGDRLKSMDQLTLLVTEIWKIRKLNHSLFTSYVEVPK